MEQELGSGAGRVAAGRSPGNPTGRITQLALCGMMAALTAVLSLVALPLPVSPVPITLQTLSVMLAAGLLGRFWGPASVTVYLLLGLVGLPVFAGGASGIGEFAGPRGGYLVGFVVAAFIMGAAADIASARRRGRGLGTGRKLGTIVAVSVLGIGGLLGTAAIYVVGVPWLSAVLGIGIGKGMAVGMLPFLPGDLLKLVVVVPLIRSVDLALARTGLGRP